MRNLNRRPAIHCPPRALRRSDEWPDHYQRRSLVGERVREHRHHQQAVLARAGDDRGVLERARCWVRSLVDVLLQNGAELGGEEAGDVFEHAPEHEVGCNRRWWIHRDAEGPAIGAECGRHRRGRDVFRVHDNRNGGGDNLRLPLQRDGDDVVCEISGRGRRSSERAVRAEAQAVRQRRRCVPRQRPDAVGIRRDVYSLRDVHGQHVVALTVTIRQFRRHHGHHALAAVVKAVSLRARNAGGAPEPCAAVTFHRAALARASHAEGVRRAHHAIVLEGDRRDVVGGDAVRW
mmetsp:Transcript_13663/g.47644  ORF Transcript_13663/g.47644 Transcript_13663/m.47644 type:complete len:290 (-) Transcript_13663:1435-2304(-)